MKNMKYVIAGILFLLALPVWRLLDWALVTVPFQTPTVVFQSLWCWFFLIMPLSLLIQKLTKPWVFVWTLLFAALSWWAGPSTSMATLHPDLTHCGRTSYAGFFYPIHGILSQVHRDDLEIRNQLCWIVKLIKQVPTDVVPDELAGRLNQMSFRLQKPELKFRASLPWITFLLGKYVTSSQIQNSPMLIQNLGHWANLYSEEVSGRDYAWFEWPHSAVVKFEYGLIEKNWETIKLEFSP